MPELPEVETVVRELRPLLTSRRITSVRRVTRKKLRKPWSSTWDNLLKGRRIDRLERRGKWIVVLLDNDHPLVFHLGMTGKLTVEPSEEPREPHVHLVFGLDEGEKELRFLDIRRFGSVTLYSSEEELNQFFVSAGLGPEPFDLDADYWRDCLGGTTRALKALLLDQQVVAGVGNIYADEALFEARLHPARRGRDLDARGAQRLRRAIAKILERAIKLRGSSIRNYVGALGRRGDYQKEHRVYGHAGKPCPRCQTPIARIRLAGRSTHFCPNCQPREAASNGKG
jgi:formamidopyrimidine-DNA glycosylase